MCPALNHCHEQNSLTAKKSKSKRSLRWALLSAGQWKLLCRKEAVTSLCVCKSAMGVCTCTLRRVVGAGDAVLVWRAGVALAWSHRGPRGRVRPSSSGRRILLGFGEVGWWLVGLFAFSTVLAQGGTDQTGISCKPVLPFLLLLLPPGSRFPFTLLPGLHRDVLQPLLF